MSKLLKDSVKLLKQVRSELHGNVEGSVIESIDLVIQNLETKQQVDSAELLNVLGKCVERLPAIIKLIEYFSKVIPENQ